MAIMKNIFQLPFLQTTHHPFIVCTLEQTTPTILTTLYPLRFHGNQEKRWRRSSGRGGWTLGDSDVCWDPNEGDIQGEERGRMVHMLLRGRWVDVREMSCIQERKGIGAGKFLSRIPFVNRAREIGYNPGGKERGFSPLPLLWWEKDDRNILL